MRLEPALFDQWCQVDQYAYSLLNEMRVESGVRFWQWRLADDEAETGWMKGWDQGSIEVRSG